MSKRKNNEAPRSPSRREFLGKAGGAATVAAAVSAVALFLVLPAVTFGTETLQIDARSTVELAGVLNGAPLPVRFASRAQDPTRAVSRIVVDALEVDADIDLRTRVVRLDGHGGEVSVEQRRTLTALGQELERLLTPYDRELPLQESLLFRLVQLFAEAPVGLTIDTAEVRGPVAGARPGPPSSLACQQGGQNGIAYLSGGCTFQPYGGICYDTATQCFACYTVANGCNAPGSCPGRCGSGCGLFGGVGAYTRDCAEHDRCCGLNGDCLNPFSLACGDEFWEAADDFLWGLSHPNCAQGCG